MHHCPRQVLDGLFTALHIQLNHPSSHQLKTVVKRYSYALDIDKAIVHVSDGPTAHIKQSTSSSPDAVGQSFPADVIKCSRQLILVLRETVTSYTSTLLLQDERHHTLRDALIQLCIQVRPMDGPSAMIHIDPAPGFKVLVNDKSLHQHRVTLELGHAKNPNKNPVTERAIQELECELLCQDSLQLSHPSLYP